MRLREKNAISFLLLFFVSEATGLIQSLDEVLTQFTQTKELKTFVEEVKTRLYSMNQDKCMNPNEQKIEEIMMENSNFFIAIPTFALLPEILNQFPHIKVFNDTGNVTFNTTIGNRNCRLLNMTIPEETATCPWHYNLVFREDRYPQIRKNAVCNCQNCRPILKYVNATCHSCKLLKELRPILYRDKCVYNRYENRYFYELKIGLEEVSIACTCMAAPINHIK